jgi:hypothetical protein
MKNWKLQFEEGLSKDDKETILRIIGVKGCIEDDGYLYPDDYNNRPHDYTKLFTIGKELTNAKSYIEFQNKEVNENRKKQIEEWMEERIKSFVINVRNYSITWNHRYDIPEMTCSGESQYTKYILSNNDCEEAISIFGQDLKLLFV